MKPRESREGSWPALAPADRACGAPICACRQGSERPQADAPRSARRPATNIRLPAMQALSIAGIALLPKCPLCFAAYLGLFASAGVPVWVTTLWGRPLTAILLALALAAIFVRSRRRGRYAPAMVALTGALLITAGKLTFNVTPVFFVGVSLLIVASMWSMFGDVLRVRKARLGEMPM